jgi:DNA-binding NtrC family response regulator
LDDQACRILQQHDWPGNVRELENLLTQAAVRARTPVITPDLLEIDSGASERGAPGGGEKGIAEARILRTLDQVESEHIQLVLDYTGGHKGRTCDILAISRPALDRKILKYRLVLPKR